MSIQENTALVKSTASALGFSFCGISKAEFLEEEAPKLESWLNRGYSGSMSYLERNFDKRLDPRLLVPGAKSVVSLMYNYFPTQPVDSDLKIAKYAYGEDYHFVVRDLLHDFLFRIRERVGDIDGRVFVDSAPVMERAWAAKAGLGWIGKNRFRVLIMPILLSLFKKRIRLSLKVEIIVFESSVEPSFIIINSKSQYVWDKILSIASLKYREVLKTGIKTLTLGVISLSMRKGICRQY